MVEVRHPAGSPQAQMLFCCRWWPPGSFHQPCLLETLWCQLPTRAKQNCLADIFIVITTVIIIFFPRRPCRGPSCPPLHVARPSD